MHREKISAVAGSRFAAAAFWRGAGLYQKREADLFKNVLQSSNIVVRSEAPRKCFTIFVIKGGKKSLPAGTQTVLGLRSKLLRSFETRVERRTFRVHYRTHKSWWVVTRGWAWRRQKGSEFARFFREFGLKRVLRGEPVIGPENRDGIETSPMQKRTGRIGQLNLA